MDRVCACIIARLNSTRLPRKVLADIEGKPLLKWIADRLNAVDNVDEVVLCTSDDPGDEELLEHADEWGIPAIAGSPTNIVSRLQKAASTFDADILLRATGDNPLISVEHTEQVVAAHKKADFDYSRVNSLPLGATVEGLSKDILPKIQDTLPSPSHSEYLVFYAFQPDRYNCVVLQPPEEMQRPHYSVTVDTPDDLERARDIFSGTQWTSEIGPPIEQITQFLDEKEAYEEIEGDMMVKMPEQDRIPYDKFLGLLEERASDSTTITLG
ncbi:cytidylyltransferase domain-containing protein [Salinibacter ruber]|uniref:cytidylyltransferase domain-containing protein n=1 Tax=Salinibacter ruber TaxID=146919 RepID=UPI0021670A2C|nr:NTP transferase domain-containing protein [Salinibacter ruber]MCS4039533.1 spore coat polysaccharide biosynthesis protein SpsF [Salinibacter ruber]